MENFWNNMTWTELEEVTNNNGIVIIPIGSMEQHGLHMPVGTDTFLAVDIVKDVAIKIKNKNIIYTSPIWMSFSPYHMDFNGTITLELNLFVNLVKSICCCISKHGFKKIILLNGHGGNVGILNSTIRELKSYNNIRVVTFSYWDIISDYINNDWRESKIGGINHAGEMETSLMLYKHNKLVKKDNFKNLTFSPKTRYIKNDLAMGSPVSVGLDFKEISETGVLGDPTTASKKRGKVLYGKIVDSLVEFLHEYKNWDIEDLNSI